MVLLHHIWIKRIHLLVTDKYMAALHDFLHTIFIQWFEVIFPYIIRPAVRKLVAVVRNTQIDHWNIFCSQIYFETQYELPTDANSSAKPKTVDKIYHVESIGENGDVILKIVNASPDTIKTNFALGGVKLKGNAAVTEIACDDWTATNTPEATPVKPESFTIGAFSKNTIGYELKPYSVVVIRVHTK